MAVITLFRQAGCRGRYIAENLARALDYHLTDYVVAERILLQCGLPRTQELYDSVPEFWDRFTRRGLERDQINSMLRSVTLAQAHHGNVVMLGRGCFAPLQGLSDVLNVRLRAPLPVRIKRIMAAQHMNIEEATAFVEEKDALVADFARTSYGLPPDDIALFDLIVDTDKVPPDTVVRCLIEAIKALESNGKEGPSAAALRVDPVIAHAVTRELDRLARLRARGPVGD